MKTYFVTCRGVFDEAVIAKLEVLRVHWRGGPDSLASDWICHYLLIEAASEDQAIQRARLAVESCGGIGTDYACSNEVSVESPQGSESRLKELRIRRGS